MPTSTTEDGHQFDRRQDDVNVKALATRVSSLEARVEVVEQKLEQNNLELVANTRLTQQVHEAMFGRGDDDVGVKHKIGEVHDAFTDFKRGLALLNRVADTGARWGKPVLYLVAVGAAAATWWKTGEFKWPTF